MGADSLLVLLQGTSPDDHPGIVDGYDRLRRSGELDHVEVVPVGGPRGTARGPAFWDDVVASARGNGTTVVVLEYYHAPDLPDPRPAIAALRALPSAPVVVSTLGDPFMNGYGGRAEVPSPFLQAAEASDLVLLSSMGAMAAHVRAHTRAPLVLAPHGVCQVRFQPPTDADLDREPEFDVVFIGSRNASRNPLRPYRRFGRERERLVDDLAARFGDRFAVFGNGWSAKAADRGPVPFGEQLRVARRGRVVVGGVPFSTARYYASNRPFIQGASGAPVVDTAVTGVEVLMRPGAHWFLADAQGMVEGVEAALDLGDERLRAVGRAAADHIFAHHTQAHRCATLLEDVRRLRDRSGAPPDLSFLLPGVDVHAEARLATDGWPGITPSRG